MRQGLRVAVSRDLRWYVFLKIAPMEGALKNWYVLNWCLSHTEVFSKRQKIYSSDLQLTKSKGLRKKKKEGKLENAKKK